MFLVRRVTALTLPRHIMGSSRFFASAAAVGAGQQAAKKKGFQKIERSAASLPSTSGPVLLSFPLHVVEERCASIPPLPFLFLYPRCAAAAPPPPSQASAQAQLLDDRVSSSSSMGAAGATTATSNGARPKFATLLRQVMLKVHPDHFSKVLALYAHDYSFPCVIYFLLSVPVTFQPRNFSLLQFPDQKKVNEESLQHLQGFLAQIKVFTYVLFFSLSEVILVTAELTFFPRYEQKRYRTPAAIRRTPLRSIPTCSFTCASIRCLSAAFVELGPIYVHRSRFTGFLFLLNEHLRSVTSQQEGHFRKIQLTLHTNGGSSKKLVTAGFR